MPITSPPIVLTDIDVEHLILPNENNFFTKTGVRITLNPPVRNTHIFFTLDGTDPTCDSPKYVCPFLVKNVKDQPVTLKVLFYDYVACTSSTYTKDITFNVIPTFDVTSEPVPDVESELTSLSTIRVNLSCHIESLLFLADLDVVGTPVDNIESTLNLSGGTVLGSIYAPVCHNIESILELKIGSKIPNIQSTLTSLPVIDVTHLRGIESMHNLNIDFTSISISSTLGSMSYITFNHNNNIASNLVPFRPLIASEIESTLPQLSKISSITIDIESVLNPINVMASSFIESTYDVSLTVITVDNECNIESKLSVPMDIIINTNIESKLPDTLEGINASVMNTIESSYSYLKIAHTQNIASILNPMTVIEYHNLCFIESANMPLDLTPLQIIALFSTDIQGSISPSVVTADNSLVSWDWDDSTATIGDNSPTHTYTDGSPSHDVDISGIDPLLITELDIPWNSEVTSIETTSLPYLEHLYFGYNKLNDLDLSNCVNLKSLSCFLNNLTDVDFSHTPLLEDLRCGGLTLNSIDVSTLINLVYLEVYTTNLTTIDLSNQPLINYFYCNTNKFDAPTIDNLLIQFDNNGISNGLFNYSNNPGESSLSACDAYYNLLLKGWTIVGENPVCTGAFRTTSQGTITPIITTSDASLTSWDWDDSTTTIGDNSPTHTYTDSQPSHYVNIFGLMSSLITELDVKYNEVIELSIEPFTNLTKLLCNNNNISVLDVSNNLSLQILECNNNSLEDLDLTNNSQLYQLWCYDNNLDELSVNHLTNLVGLNCQGNNLTEIDVSNLTSLQGLGVNRNNLTEIDISNNINLDIFGCYVNNITELDVTNNTLLIDLEVGSNLLTTLDISNNPLLAVLYTDNNQLSTLDISNNPLLGEVRINNNQLTSSAINIILTQLDANGILNGVLNYSNNPGESSLTTCVAYDNLIAKGWTITGQVPVCNTVLFTTTSQGTVSTLIDTSDSTLSSWSWGDGNTTLDDNNPSHTYVDGLPSHTVNINIADPLSVTDLFCNTNSATSLDVTPYVNLDRLLCYTNNLSVLDVSNLTLMQDLKCHNNTISVLDVSNMTVLQYLHCYTNNISELDVSNSTQLLILRCHGNTISLLDVSNLTQITSLGCFNNNISELDISNSTQLLEVEVHNNSLPSDQIDQILIDLDSHGLSNGILNYSGNVGESSLTAITSYNNLISKGWTITGAIPGNIYESFSGHFDGTNYVSSDGSAFAVTEGLSTGAVVTLEEPGPEEFAVNSVDLNGSNQYFSSPQVTTTTSVSIDFWVKLNSLPSNNLGAIIQRNGTTGLATWQVEINSDGGVELSGYSGSGWLYFSRAPIGTLATNTWYHIVATKENGDNGYIYVNSNSVGVSQGSSSINTSLTNQTLQIGRGADGLGGTTYLDGSICLPLIANRVLSSSEITTLYNNGIPKCYEDIATSITDDCVYAPSLYNGANISVGQEIVDQSSSGITTTAIGSPTYTDQGLSVECMPSDTAISPVNSATLNGTSQYLVSTDANLYSFGTESVFISGWVKSGVGSTLYFKGNESGTGSEDLFINFGSLASREVIFDLSVNISNRRQWITTTTPIPDDNEWHHIAIYHSRASDSTDPNLWVDGIDLGTFPHSYTIGGGWASSNYTQTQPVKMGIVAIGPSYYVDDTGAFVNTIKGYSPTQADIDELYNNGNPKCYDEIDATLKSRFTSFIDVGTFNGSTEVQALTEHIESHEFTNVNNAPFTGTGLSVECGGSSTQQTILSKGTVGSEGYSLMRNADNTVDFNLVSDSSSVESVNSANLNGTSQYFSYPASQAVEGVDATFCYFIKSSDISATRRVFHGMRKDGDNYLIVELTSTGLHIENWSAGSLVLDQTLSYTFNEGVWYGVVLSQVSGVLKLYVNGSFVGNFSAPLKTSFSSPSVTYGAYPTGLNFQGSMSFVSYNRTYGYNQSDVTEWYNGGDVNCYEDRSSTLKTGEQSAHNLATWTGSNEPTTDKTGNGNNLTAVGSPTFTDQGLTVECGSSTSTTITSPALTTGTPYTIDATYDSTEGIARLYVDRSEVAASSANPSPIKASSEDLKIGDGLTGCLQMPYVSDRKFSASEIAALSIPQGLIPYYDLSTSITDDMLGHWNVSNWNNGKNAGQELLDNTGNTNDLTANGTVNFDCDGEDVFDSEEPYVPFPYTFPITF